MTNRSSGSSAKCPVTNPALIHDDGGNIWAGGGALRGNSGWFIFDHRLALHFESITKYGFAQKIFWQLINGARGPITLTGQNLDTHQRIWFGHPVPDMHPKPGVAPRVIAWPVGLVRVHQAPPLTLVPGVGCSTLHAKWAKGSWTLTFIAAY